MTATESEDPATGTGETGTVGGAGSGDDRLARELAERVRSCPDVAGLSTGPFGTVASYLPGHRIHGVAVRDDEIEIAVVAHYGRPLPEIADQVREAVAPLAGGRPIHVAIDDLNI
ncbi:hypothetical protein [Microtetraspora sp. NBRC 13810]|uniref:hypothetical protein n=1 Tax=Microtetraspora sp. NBRC 13810 TaxID=3030990 RepID=UPI002553BAD6|nr:hypothetical protein [Microtetraspora sp. NBRC 13810]